jgi:hypothetical protein
MSGKLTTLMSRLRLRGGSATSRPAGTSRSSSGTNYSKRTLSIEKKLYNLSKVVRTYRNDADMRKVDDILYVVSQAKRLYPSPRMAGIRGITSYTGSMSPFDPQLAMMRILHSAKEIYNELHAKYLVLVNANANAAQEQRGGPDTVRASQNIQRERYLRKRAMAAVYAKKGKGARKRASSGGAFPLGQLPQGVARLVASKLRNTNLASFAASSKNARNEAQGLLPQRLQPYVDFMSTLLSDILYYAKASAWDPEIPDPKPRAGWVKNVSRGWSHTYDKTTTSPPFVKMTMDGSDISVHVHVQDKTSKAGYSIEYFIDYGDDETRQTPNTLIFRWTSGSQTSEFIKRSYEALRRVAASNRIKLNDYMPRPAPNRLD